MISLQDYIINEVSSDLLQRAADKADELSKTGPRKQRSFRQKQSERFKKELNRRKKAENKIKKQEGLLKEKEKLIKKYPELKDAKINIIYPDSNFKKYDENLYKYFNKLIKSQNFVSIDEFEKEIKDCGFRVGYAKDWDEDLEKDNTNWMEIYGDIWLHFNGKYLTSHQRDDWDEIGVRDGSILTFDFVLSADKKSILVYAITPLEELYPDSWDWN